MPYWFHSANGEPFAFAGLWERWNKGDAPMETCTILTTRPNELVAPFHDRMPVILSPADYDKWMDQTNNDPESYPASELIDTAVNPVVNNAQHDGPDCIEAFQAA